MSEVDTSYNNPISTYQPVSNNIQANNFTSFSENKGQQYFNYNQTQQSLQTMQFGNWNHKSGIDERLRQLEEETRQMEAQFKFIQEQKMQRQNQTEKPFIGDGIIDPKMGKTINVLAQTSQYDPHQSNFLGSLSNFKSEFDQKAVAGPNFGPLSDKMINYSVTIKKDRENKSKARESSQLVSNFHSNYANNLQEKQNDKQNQAKSQKNQRYQDLPQVSKLEQLQQILDANQSNFTAQLQNGFKKNENLQQLNELFQSQSILKNNNQQSSIAYPPCQNSKITVAKQITLKPQITKEYINAQTIGRPDFTILEDFYEKGHRFYEPQYSILQNRKCHHETEEQFKRPKMCQDEQIEKADVQFRETESQKQHQDAVFIRIQNEYQDAFYDSFM